MIRLGVATVAALLAFCLSASAQMVIKSEDGSMQLTLPNGWKEGKAGGANVKIRATDGRGATVIISALPKEDFKDFKAFTNFVDEKMKRTLSEGEPTTTNVKVDGRAAVRTTASGTEANGRNVTLIFTYVDAGPVYVAVRVWASASDFERQQQVLVGLADQLKINTPAAAAPPPPPAAPPPAAKPPGK
jgi:hypothetical protein